MFMCAQRGPTPEEREIPQKQVVNAAAILAAASAATLAHAQWVPDYQRYSIQRIGLFGPEQTGSAGYQFSDTNHQNNAGHVAGSTRRLTGVETDNGIDTCAYNPITNSTVQTSLTGPEHTGSAGYQYGLNRSQNDAGQVAGSSWRISGVSDYNGENVWAYDPATNTRVVIGLTGAGHTGGGGYQYSVNHFQNNAGQVAGSSWRVPSLFDYSGENTWVYDSVTNTTVQTGLTGPAHTGSAGYQVSLNTLQNDAGQIAGGSVRITGVNTDNGLDAWVYNPTTNTSTQIGLTGASYVGSDGYQFSDSNLQNATGQIAGYSKRFAGVSVYDGQNTWVYNPVTNTSVQTGLTGAAHIGSNGYQVSVNNFQNDANQVAGYSQRFTGVATDNGLNTWVYDQTTNTTVQTGLTGSAHTGTAEYQFSVNIFQNEAGQVAGHSWRITGANTNNGQNTWVYNSTSNTTMQTGLTGSAHAGSGGFQFGENSFQGDAGQVAGTSRRILGTSTNNGQNTWVYNPSTGTTVQTGLTGAAQTGNGGFQFSTNSFQHGGQFAGISRRIVSDSVNVSNGQNTWVFDAVTSTTVQTGLTGPLYTGSAGYQSSNNSLQNESGQVAGYSQRITGVNTINGEDTWYFDPFTSLTIAVIGSVRTIDNYAFSTPTILTDGGFLLGHYTFFEGGLGLGEQRAFIFHPDLGLTDLGNLVNGGLTANGWQTLQYPIFTDALNTIVGYGYVNGQTQGQSVFVMTIPAPSAAGLLALGGLITTRRRRDAAAI